MNHNENFMSHIKSESMEIIEKHDEFLKENFDEYSKNDFLSTCDPALIEINYSNEKINENINNFFRMKEDKINKKNLLNYCGILDPVSETVGCARSKSIYVAKFGNSHIKKSKIINPYGALSQKYQQEMLNVQKKKLIDFTKSYVKPIDVNQLNKDRNGY
ncbi:MAP3K12-binding inhibitory 1 [Brachionus plicatilis]|uniref:MAP3K12-binding inhibitory 1 n=1 Tax=Brachionus plicatilis TaxID=10195 RepID=A0A3M7RWR4_BRAPC|nr:MAP3K12-binding inhibitory 1 [Brachionus plicatilis]